MRRLFSLIPTRTFWSDRRGTASVEYALIIAFIVLVMVVALSQVADMTVRMWSNVSDKVTTAR